MCFYIFAPGKYINIEYLSESVSLGSWGGSSVIADIVVENSDHKGDIAELLILFPKTPFNIKVRKRKPPKYIETLSIKNRTKEILDERSSTNKTYKLSGIEVERESKNPHKVKLRRINPEKLEKPFIFEAEVVDEAHDSFDIYKTLSEESNNILISQHYSVLHYQFKTHIKPEAKRWLRLEFSVKNAAMFHAPKHRALILWLIDNLKYNFHLMGPLDVLNIFNERIDLVKYHNDKEIENAGKNPPPELMKMKIALEEIENKILSPLNSSKTTFQDITLHIFPLKYRTLQYIYPVGKIQPRGVIPNYLPLDNGLNKEQPSWKRRVYDWHAEEVHDRFTDTYSLFLTGKQNNRIFYSVVLFIIIWFVFGIIFPSLISELILWLDNPLATKFGEILKNITDFLFIKYPWASLGLGIILGSYYNRLANLIKRSYGYFFN
ncbi:MAG: hypothetical protein MI892_08785 [Desulfobacterales bacterium]|nr:hypothetical protein [Desulfobacterales bacterium]